MKLTYKKSGVDISRGNRLVHAVRPMARSTFSPDVMNDIGSFGAFYRLDKKRYRDPVLVSGTDGVGTKLKIAFLLKNHRTVGIDLVAMCVNDILTSGARPLFFLDYFATGKLSIRQAADVISGIAEGCRISGCSLIGGETAEMPGFYARGEYDIAGFAVGVVDRTDIINGASIRRGDMVIGLASSGLHSNGYSLVRKIFFDVNAFSPRRKFRELGCSLGTELLKPTRIYVKSVLALIKKCRVEGIAHITGGGLTENLPRLLPSGSGLKFLISMGSWTVPPIFHLMQKLSSIPDAEMFRTFNMGIGLALVVRPSLCENIIRRLARLGETACVIGGIEKGTGGVEYV